MPDRRLPFIKTYEDGHREGLLMDMLPKLLETAGINDTVDFLLAKDNNPDGECGKERLLESVSSGQVQDCQQRKISCNDAGFIDAFNEDQADLALYPVIIGKSIQAQAQQTAAFLNGGLQLLVRKKERDSGEGKEAHSTQTEEAFHHGIGHACVCDIHVMHPSAISHGVLSVRVDLADQIFTFLAPFSAYLWICIICSALAVFIVWIIIGKLSPLGTYTVRRMRRIDSPDEDVKEFAIESGEQECSLVTLPYSVHLTLPCPVYIIHSVAYYDCYGP